MDYLKLISQEIRDGISLRNDFLEQGPNLAWIAQVADAMVSSLRSGGKVIFAGNGGSFADAQHLSAEFLGRFMVDREPLAAHCLGTNSSLATAVGNDYDFNQVFSRELKGVGKPEDILLLITTSGNSDNLQKAAEVAASIGIKSFGLVGKGGGELAKAVDCLVIASDHTARIQEMHITVGHIICGLVDAALIGQ